MTLAVPVGPPTVTINRDDRVVVCQPDGRIDGAEEQGFFARDTRFISGYDFSINGVRPTLLNSSAVEFFSSRFEFTNPDLIDEDGVIPRHTVSLRLDRTVSGGVHEDYDVINYSRRPIRITLEISITSDFADIFDVKARRLVRRGEINTQWSSARRSLRTTYRNRTFRRDLLIQIDKADSRPQFANGRLIFVATIEPKGVWHTCLRWIPLTQSGRYPPTLDCSALTTRPQAIAPPLPGVGIDAPNETVVHTWRRSVRDMEALRLEDPQFERGVYIPAAGVPWFVTLFGRDALVVSMQGISGFPEFAAGALRRLSNLQATEDDPERDMEPGKIPHEIRHGELAQLGILPFTPYYGTHDATSLFVIVISYLYQWLGDVEVLNRYLPNAEAAMAWIDTSGDRDGDGFQEYRTRSSHGYYNQGWKDAGDAILEADGSLSELPIGTCELQGYAYDAKLRLGDIYETLGRLEDAERLHAEARRLYERFNNDFWWESEGTYYLGLNGRKQPIESVASNPGHCLASGIVPTDRAGRVVERLMASDMWSGWGIRTLSSDHVAYNPFSYHTGHRLAARQRDDRRWLPSVRLHRRGRARRKGDLRRRGALRRQSAAGAVRRVASPAGQLPGAVPRGKRAAGLGRGIRLPVCRDPVRDPCLGRTRQAPAVRRPGAARLAAAAHDQQPPGGPGCADARVRRRTGGGGVEHERVRGRPRPGSAAGRAAAGERAAGGRPVGTSRPALNAGRSGVSP